MSDDEIQRQLISALCERVMALEVWKKQMERTEQKPQIEEKTQTENSLAAK